MVNKAGTIISTLVDYPVATAANKLGTDDQSGIGAPFVLESGNSIQGLFRGDQIAFADGGTATSAYTNNVEEDWQVILYIAKRGKNGGRWAAHERPTLWATDGL